MLNSAEPSKGCLKVTFGDDIGRWIRK